MLVQSAFKLGDTIVHTKRMSYSKAKMLGVNINHRKVDEHEIVFDIDAYNKQICMYVYKLISANLRMDKYSHKIYDTGSKGYHIHLIMSELADYDLEKRKKARRLFLEYYGRDRKEYIDYHKISDKVMIRMEGSKHEVTGNIKKCIEEYDFDCENELPNWIKKELDNHIQYDMPRFEVDWLKGNKVLNWCMCNKIPAGCRNIWLFKNVAILIMKLGLEEKGKAMIDKIHSNTGEHRRDIYGWINYFKKKSEVHYNQTEVDKWFQKHNVTFGNMQ